MSKSNAAAPNDTEEASVPLEILIGERLEQLAPLSASCCIYRVPETIRCQNPNVYTPKVVSIGPLHHGKETLQDMEEHKYRYLKEFLHRTQEKLECCIQKIRLFEEELRSYYEETIKYSSDDFISIILVDSAFIIELLLKYHLQDADRADPKIDYIRYDLLLLENQVPFFILEALFDPRIVNPSYHGEGKKLLLIQLFRKFFSYELDSIGVDDSLETANSYAVKGEHILDIIRKLCLPPEPLGGGSRNPAAIFAPSITELHRAGVKLKVRSTRNLFSIRFDNGILEIPKLTVSDDLERILRNLAAYEQCHYRTKRIADYLDLLDSFVNTPNDVELLVKYGIVINVFGDTSEACSMINSLCKGVLGNYNDFCFSTLYEDLHKHCKRPWNKWKANLRQNYMNTPWAVVSVVAAIFLIMLTVIQTVCALIDLSPNLVSTIS